MSSDTCKFLVQAVCEYGKAPYKPHSSAREVVWIWNEVGELLFGRLPACRSLSEAAHALTETARLLLSSVDAVLDPADPLPFLGLHYMQVMQRVQHTSCAPRDVHQLYLCGCMHHCRMRESFPCKLLAELEHSMRLLAPAVLANVM